MPDSAARYVKLFTNGRNQAVRIPREFELPGEDAIMRKEGDRLIIEPVSPRSLLALLATLEPIAEEFPVYRIFPSTTWTFDVRYLLDTNIISAMVRDPRGVIAKRIHDVGEATVSTSIVAATLRYGAAKKGSARLSAQLDLCSTRWTCCPSRYPLMGVTANCARS